MPRIARRWQWTAAACYHPMDRGHNRQAIFLDSLAVLRDLRHRLYARLQRLSLSWYDRTPAGSILSRLMDDVAAIGVLITGPTFATLTDLGTTVAVSALLAWRSPRLFLVVLAFVPAYALTFRWFISRIRTDHAAVRDQDGDLPEPAQPIPLGRACGLVEFDRIRFAY